MKLYKITSQPKSVTILIPKTDLQRSVRQNQKHNNLQYYQELYQERVGILQYDGCYTKEEAETMARKLNASDMFRE